MCVCARKRGRQADEDIIRQHLNLRLYVSERVAQHVFGFLWPGRAPQGMQRILNRVGNAVAMQSCGISIFFLTNCGKLYKYFYI